MKIRILIAIVVVCSSTLMAQDDSRTEIIIQQQKERSKKLNPYGITRGERLAERIERFFTAPDGPYLFFGGIYSGSWIAFGPGYRRSFGDTGVFDVHAAWSLRNYVLLDTSVKLPDAASGKLTSLIHARYFDADKNAFYGIGNDTSKDDEVSYQYSPVSLKLTEMYRPVRWLGAGLSLEYLDTDSGPGEESDVPTVNEVFTPETLPGLKSDPDYFVGGLIAEIDYRESPGYTASGGYYRAEWLSYNEVDDQPFEFRQWNLDANQFIPILRKNQVIALRARATITDVDDGNEIPYFLLSRLGGGRELRGFSRLRFRDKHRLLLTAEYRWTPSKFLDLALFYDWGKVASDTSDLDFNDLHGSYGIGARFHGPSFTALRIELARSNESTRLIIGGGMVF